MTTFVEEFEEIIVDLNFSRPMAEILIRHLKSVGIGCPPAQRTYRERIDLNIFERETGVYFHEFKTGKKAGKVVRFPFVKIKDLLAEIERVLYFHNFMIFSVE